MNDNETFGNGRNLHWFAAKIGGDAILLLTSPFS